MGGGGQVSETPQQRAAADHAAKLMDDYKSRWLPVQMKLASHVQQTGKEGSAARRMATGQASTDAAIQFNQAEGGLEKTLTDAGAGPASSRFKLGLTGLGANAAQESSKSQLIADQQISDAYTRGLGAVMALGRGERAMAGQGFEKSAAMSGQMAAAQNAASAQKNAGIAGLLAQGLGYGLQQGLGALTSTPPADMGTGSATADLSPSQFAQLKSGNGSAEPYVPGQWDTPTP